MYPSASRFLFSVESYPTSAHRSLTDCNTGTAVLGIRNPSVRKAHVLPLIHRHPPSARKRISNPRQASPPLPAHCRYGRPIPAPWPELIQDASAIVDCRLPPESLCRSPRLSSAAPRWASFVSDRIRGTPSCGQDPFRQRPDTRFRRPNATSPSIPDPNSHTAGGNGTAETAMSEPPPESA